MNVRTVTFLSCRTAFVTKCQQCVDEIDVGGMVTPKVGIFLDLAVSEPFCRQNTCENWVRPYSINGHLQYLDNVQVVGSNVVQAGFGNFHRKISSNLSKAYNVSTRRGCYENR